MNLRGECRFSDGLDEPFFRWEQRLHIVELTELNSQRLSQF